MYGTQYPVPTENNNSNKTLNRHVKKQENVTIINT
jgi:hypothetical protein